MYLKQILFNRQMSVPYFLACTRLYCSFGLTQKNQKVKAAPASLLSPFIPLLAPQTRFAQTSDAHGRSIPVARLTLTSRGQSSALPAYPNLPKDSLPKARKPFSKAWRRLPRVRKPFLRAWRSLPRVRKSFLRAWRSLPRVRKSFLRAWRGLPRARKPFSRPWRSLPRVRKPFLRSWWRLPRGRRIGLGW